MMTFLLFFRTVLSFRQELETKLFRSLVWKL